MANTILHKKSATPAAIPTTGQLTLGEIAVNTYDGKLYMKKDDGVASVVEIGGVDSQVLAINAQTGTTYTLVIDDRSKLITMSNAAAIALTIPTNASVAFPIGTQILIEQEGAGNVTISGAGVTIHSAGSFYTTASQYTAITLIKKAVDTWLLVGDLA